MRYVLLLSCPDTRGIVARLSRSIFEMNGDIIHADQHLDTGAGQFLTRFEWQDSSGAPPDEIEARVRPLANDLQATWRLHNADVKQKVSIWVTHQEHCLVDLLMRVRLGELPCEIVHVVSNRESLRAHCEKEGLAFVHLLVTEDTRADSETSALRLLSENGVQLVVLAKYMQILSDSFLRSFPSVINIHHSFLPAFRGARPYHQAFARGVKLIGATAHYATADLDEGPIIEQEVLPVTHRESEDELVQKGRDVERMALARAVKAHLEHRVLVYGNKTVVFS